MALDRILTDGSETGLSVANKINTSFDSIDENDLNRHNHSNLAILNNIIDTGTGDNYLSDDGTYKAINTTTNWGDIGGTLSNQTDLQSALNLKANLSGAIFTGDVQLVALKTNEATFDFTPITSGGSDLNVGTNSLRFDNLNFWSDTTMKYNGNDIYHTGNLDPSVYLKNVVEDTTPQLGGNLQLNNNKIIFDDGSTFYGTAGSYSDGVYIAYSDDGNYYNTNGGLQLTQGSLIARGTKVSIESLKGTEYRQVYVSKDGDLFGVTPPASGWTVSDTSTDTVDLQQSIGTWFAIPNLKIALPEDVATNDILDVTATVMLQNYANQEGFVEFGIGIGGSQPTNGYNNTLISKNFYGGVSTSLGILADNDLSTGTELTFYIKIATGGDPAFDPWVHGGLGTHDLVVVSPQSGGGDVVEWGSITI